MTVSVRDALIYVARGVLIYDALGEPYTHASKSCIPVQPTLMYISCKFQELMIAMKLTNFIA